MTEISENSHRRWRGSDSPAPDVRPTTLTSPVLHPLRDLEVLSTMIPAHATWGAVRGDCLEEELQHGEGSVVGMDADARHESGETVDKAVDDKLPPDQAWE